MLHKKLLYYFINLLMETHINQIYFQIFGRNQSIIHIEYSNLYPLILDNYQKIILLIAPNIIINYKILFLLLLI